MRKVPGTPSSREFSRVPAALRSALAGAVSKHSPPSPLPSPHPLSTNPEARPFIFPGQRESWRADNLPGRIQFPDSRGAEFLNEGFSFSDSRFWFICVSAFTETCSHSRKFSRPVVLRFVVRSLVLRFVVRRGSQSEKFTYRRHTLNLKWSFFD